MDLYSICLCILGCATLHTISKILRLYVIVCVNISFPFFVNGVVVLEFKPRVSHARKVLYH